MSTGSIGTLGFDDDSGQSPWDDGGILWTLTTGQVAPYTSPIFDCSRFGYVYCEVGVTVANALFEVQWFADPAGTILLGGRNLPLGSAGFFRCQVTFASLGPYVRFSFPLPAGPTAYTPNALAMLTNRTHPLPMYPVNPFVVNYGLAIAAGGTRTFQATDFFAGEVGLRHFGGNTGLSAVVNVLDNNLAYQPFFDYTVAAGASFYQRIVLPFSSVQWVLTNSSGAVINSTHQLMVIDNVGAL